MARPKLPLYFLEICQIFAYDNIRGTGTHFVSKYLFFQSHRKKDSSLFFVHCIRIEHISSAIFSTRGLVTKIVFI